MASKLTNQACFKYKGDVHMIRARHQLDDQSYLVVTQSIGKQPKLSCFKLTRTQDNTFEPQEFVSPDYIAEFANVFGAENDANADPYEQQI